LVNAFSFGNFAIAQDISSLVQKVKAKIEQVNSYEVAGRMKTNVSFLKVPCKREGLF
jgi:hypothetical protein